MRLHTRCGLGLLLRAGDVRRREGLSGGAMGVPAGVVGAGPRLAQRDRPLIGRGAGLGSSYRAALLSTDWPGANRLATITHGGQGCQ